MPSADQVTAAQARARDRGFLWRIERDGRRSWLYGTVHVARFEWAFPGPQLMAALREAQTVALELDLADPSLMQAQRTRTAGEADTPLPTGLQQRLQQRLAAECLPAGAVETLPVMLQAATLTALAGRRDGLDPAYAIDAMLAGFGHAAGKRVVALETLEQQLDVLRGDSPGDTLRFVSQTLDELDQGRARAQLKRIAQAWADGDLATLERYPQWCECLQTPADRALMRRLLDERNAGMAERIDRLHRDGGGVFAAVGSLHFIGPQGLLALLSARGYRVERVTFGR